MATRIEIGPGVPTIESQYFLHPDKANDPNDKWILIELYGITAQTLREMYGDDPRILQIVAGGFVRALPKIESETITEIVLINVLGFNHSFPGTRAKQVGEDQYYMESLVREAYRILVPEGIVTVGETRTPTAKTNIIPLFKNYGFSLIKDTKEVGPYYQGDIQAGWRPQHHPQEYLLQFQKPAS